MRIHSFIAGVALLTSSAAWSQTIQFAKGTFAVNEGAGTLSVEVVRSGNLVGESSVTFSTSGGTATAGVDFTDISGRLLWASGDGASKAISIPITDDGLSEGDETFGVSLSDPTGAVLGATNSAQVTLVDNDGAQSDSSIQFIKGSYSVSESGDSVEISVVRQGTLTGAAAVGYSTASGTATGGSDFVETSGSLSWGAGEGGARSITVEIVNDELNEPTEEFTVQLSTATGAVIGAPSTASVQIGDDDDPTLPTAVAFSKGAFTVDEGSGTASIGIVRTGGLTEVSSVSLVVTGGTATSGQDFQDAGTTVVFASGEGGIKSVTLPIVDDGNEEPAETVNLQLIAPTGAALGSPAGATLTILDNDGANASSQVGFVVGAFSVSEDADFIEIPVVRTGTLTSAASVAYSTLSGSATAGSDFQNVGGSLLWAAGDGQAKIIRVPIIADQLGEGDETFQVRLSSPGGARLGSIPEATITILDDEGGVTPAISFVKSRIGVSEGADEAVVAVLRTGSGAGPASASIFTSGGTATSGADFADTAETVSWESGEVGVRLIAIPIIDDAEIEALETIVLGFAGVAGAQVGAIGSASIEILDNDVVPTGAAVQFVAGAVSASESSGTVEITVVRSGDAILPASVNYRLVGGTAKPAIDFLDAAGVLRWAAGDSEPKTISIGMIDDSEVEGTEILTAVLESPEGAGLGATSSSVISIVDDETVSAGELRFASPSLTISETAGSATLTVRRVNGSAGAVEVGVFAEGDTARSGIDFTMPSTAVSWAAGDVENKTLVIPIIDNSNRDGDRQFRVLMSETLGGAVVGSPSEALITIVDDEVDAPGQIQLVETSLEVSEGGGQALIFAERVGGSAGAVSVQFVSNSGSALAGQDFQQTQGTVEWEDGDAGTRVIAIPLIDDALNEGSETFQVVLAGPTGGASLVAGRGSAAVSILDDDGQRGALTLSVSQSTVDADAGFVRAVVTRSAGASGTASVQVRAIDGSAIEGTDYVLGDSGIETLTWASGEAGPKVATISLVAGEPGSAPKSFSVSLQGGEGAVIDGGSSLVTITIGYPRAPENTGVGAGGLGLWGLALLLALVGLRWNQAHKRGQRARTIRSAP